MSYNNFDQNPTIFDLISEYEEMSQTGTVTFLEEKHFFQLIEYYERECILERALEVVDFALEHHQFSADFYIKKAQLLIDTKQAHKAMVLLNRAEAYAPSELQVFLLRAEALTALDYVDEALEILENLKTSYNHQKQLSSIYVAEAQVFEVLEQHERMFYALKAALLEDPNNREALERLWLCVEISKKYEESVELHEEILDIDPYSYMAWYNLGHAHAYLGNYQDAIEAYEYAFITNDKFEFAYRDCAEICFQLKKYQKALECYQEVLEFFEPDSDLFLRIGQCYQYLGSYSIARTFYNRAIRLDVHNDEVFFHIGECFASEDNWRKAVASYKKAINIEDKREEYFAALAEAYYQIGEYKKAEPLFLRAIEIAPDQSQYWIQYASYLMEIHQGQEALNILEEAENYAVGTELLYCRIACLFSVGRRQEALYYLVEALEEDYEMHDALFDLAPYLENDKDVIATIQAFGI